MPRLEDWCITDVDGSGARLLGKVFGHPTVTDGHRCSTSRIVYIDNSGAVVTESGTAYELGKPMPGAVEEWRQAHKSLLDKLEGIGINVERMFLGR